jgi:hypothetical protein
LFKTVWTKYREPVEKYWVPYLDGGGGTLDEAIDHIVAAIPRSN